MSRLSALEGDNVIVHSERTPWYAGPSLLNYLETVEIDTDRIQNGPLRMPVQWVNRAQLGVPWIRGHDRRWVGERPEIASASCPAAGRPRWRG